jgi:hypothetical protein
MQLLRGQRQMRSKSFSCSGEMSMQYSCKISSLSLQYVIQKLLQHMNAVYFCRYQECVRYNIWHLGNVLGKVSSVMWNGYCHLNGQAICSRVTNELHQKFSELCSFIWVHSDWHAKDILELFYKEFKQRGLFSSCERTATQHRWLSMVLKDCYR